MAARRRSEEEAPEVGLVADPDGETEDEGVPEGFTVEEDEEELDEDELEDGEEELDEDDESALEEGLEEEDLADVDAVLAGAGASPTPVAAPVDDDGPEIAVLPAEEDEDEVEGIRDDIEFVCVRCRLVKRTSQLAKGARKKEPFCRSCA